MRPAADQLNVENRVSRQAGTEDGALYVIFVEFDCIRQVNSGGRKEILSQDRQ
jgi:hypothetical protein